MVFVSDLLPCMEGSKFGRWCAFSFHQCDGFYGLRDGHASERVTGHVRVGV